MTEKRFEIIPFDANGNTILIDRKGELIAVPLDFSFDILTEEEKRRLNEWIDFLNKNDELNIPVDEIKDTVKDGLGRTVGVYYND